MVALVVCGGVALENFVCSDLDKGKRTRQSRRPESFIRLGHRLLLKHNLAPIGTRARRAEQASQDFHPTSKSQAEQPTHDSTCKFFLSNHQHPQPAFDHPKVHQDATCFTTSCKSSLPSLRWTRSRPVPPASELARCLQEETGPGPRKRYAIETAVSSLTHH